MNAYDKIRAALEMARELVPAGLGMPAYANEALAELAKLERAAAEPLFILTTGAIDSDGEQDDWDIECDSSRRLESFCAAHPGDTVKLYAYPPTPVAGIREVVYATAEMASRVANSYFGTDTPADMSDMMEVLGYWQRELGPTLGLVELKEPTPEECRDIWREAKANEGDGSKVCAGRAMFDACRAVLWPKEGE